MIITVYCGLECLLFMLEYVHEYLLIVNENICRFSTLSLIN